MFTLLLLVALWMGVGVWSEFDARIKRHWRAINFSIFWNGTLRYYFEGYLPMGHLAFMHLKTGYHFNSFVKLVVCLSEIWELALHLILPYWIYLLFRKNYTRFRQPRWKRRFGEITNSLS